MKSLLGKKIGMTQVFNEDGTVFPVEVSDNHLELDGVERACAIVKDMTERKQAEEVLLAKENELENQAEHLEKTNTALKVLLAHRDEEKKKIEENMLANVAKLIMPYIEKMELSRIDASNRAYLSIIKSNLLDLISPFANRLSSKLLKLTPKEIQIAGLIKREKTSKEIGALMNLSLHAISFHRNNIRKKLGLVNKDINLTSYLQSLPKSK